MKRAGMMAQSIIKTTNVTNKVLQYGSVFGFHKKMLVYASTIQITSSNVDLILPYSVKKLEKNLVGTKAVIRFLG